MTLSANPTAEASSRLSPPGQKPLPGSLPRLASLDAFRGVVILTMTFVNYLAGVKNIPAWAKHAPEELDGFTFVDVVFPGFLFIVGVAIPLALHKRLARGESVWSLLQRVLVRSVSLIFVGVLMVNSSVFSAVATGMSKSLWYLLAYLAVVVLWSTRESAPNTRARSFVARYGLRVVAGVVLAVLLAAFRGNNGEGQVVWLQHSWWGILGLIGWAYLVCCVAYLVFRGSSVALMGVLGFLLALYIGDHHGALDWLGPVHNFIGVGAVLGSTSANVMMGVLVGNCFVGARAARTADDATERKVSASGAASFMFVFGVGLLLAGELVRPLHGIHKNAATEAYALVTGGICSLGFLAVYFLMDRKRLRRWAAAFVPIGQNALLAYLLPGIVGNLFAVIGLGKVLWPYGSGWPGALNAGAVTLLILFITWGATRLGLRLKL